MSMASPIFLNGVEYEKNYFYYYIIGKFDVCLCSRKQWMAGL